MGWLKYLFLVIAIASLPMGTVNGGELMKTISRSANTVVRKPFLWLRDTYSEQLYTYRASEFKNCLNVSRFDLNRIIIRGEDLHRYAELNQPWNQRIEKQYPLAFVLPNSLSHVVKIVKCGVQTKVQLVPNSGGLSFESLSWGTNWTVVLDFQDMRSITTEEVEGKVTVSVEPGALVGQIHAHLWKKGGYGLAMSNHLTAGMAGDAIGGGHGAFSGLYGLTVDNILSLEMVDTYGEVHIANDTKNPDLFFGLRGMGPGLIGIVTRMKLKTFKASDLHLTYTTLNYPLNQAGEVYDAFQKFHTWVEGNDPTISRALSITNDAYNVRTLSLLEGTTVNLLHIHDPQRQPKSNESFLEAVSSIFPNAREASTTHPNYFQFVITTGYAPIDLPREIGGKPSFDIKVKLIKGESPTEAELYQLMEVLSKGRASKRYFKIKSFFVETSQLNKINSIIKGMAKNVLVQVSSQTGSVQKHARNENAYVHRNATFNLSVRYEGSSKSGAVEHGMNWLHKFWDAVQFMDSGETYQNYHDLELEDHLGRNYKQDLGKLVDAKRKWDPQEYFKTELSLPIQIVRH